MRSQKIPAEQLRYKPCSFFSPFSGLEDRDQFIRSRSGGLGIAGGVLGGQNLGVYGVRWAMVTGQLLRAIIYPLYFSSGRWKRKKG